jgi:SAM-dependent methyltransferase
MNPIKKIFRGLLARNSSREYLAEFIQKAAASVPPGSMVLDAGAGENTQYENYFANQKYESADNTGDAESVTYICDLAALPMADNRYDMILCTQVLEHVPRPEAVLGELFRVLKPGCKLWLSAPVFYEEHLQPYDFYRYTRFGLVHLFENAGFQIDEFFELEGYYGTLSYQLNVASRSLPRRPAAYGGGIIGVAASIMAAFLVLGFPFLAYSYAVLDRRVKHIGNGHCKNYCVVASKTKK